MDRPIARRDFLNGVAVGIGVLGATPATDLLRAALFDVQAEGGYPPARTGLRGSHDGAFENAHRVRDGIAPAEWGRPTDTGETYDLVIVGAGISGLSAAWFHRQQHGAGARILILDNHDDFGGHAQRNEFTVGGRTLIGYAGTQSLDHPSQYSDVAKGLLRELGIDVAVFDTAYDQTYFERRRLGTGVFFDRETFGADRLVVKAHEDDDGNPAFLRRTPLSPAVQREIARLHRDRTDYLAGRSAAQKRDLLARTSYADFLIRHVRCPREVLPYFQTWTHDYFGVGIDAVPAADCRVFGFPGFDGLGLDDTPGPGLGRTALLQQTEEPYIHHFPDGNATITRLLVRALVPGAVPGTTMTDVVTARVAYDHLDRAANAVRIRLSSTVVNARNRGGGVDVTYVTGNAARRVRGRRCIMACWNGVTSYVVPELPDAQKSALRYGVKVPLVYTNVVLRDWKALEKLGVHSIECPGSYYTNIAMDFPVSLGSYRYPQRSDEPVVIALHRSPCKPGLPVREQHRAGRMELLGTLYATHERHVREQLARTLGGGGFDPARDIAAITVNRWPHGYAYEYNSLWDPVWKPGEAPCEVARRPVGNIAIANADAAAYAYTDAAIDQAWRAVQELAQPARTRAG